MALFVWAALMGVIELFIRMAVASIREWKALEALKLALLAEFDEKPKGLAYIQMRYGRGDPVTRLTLVEIRQRASRLD